MGTPRRSADGGRTGQDAGGLHVGLPPGGAARIGTQRRLLAPVRAWQPVGAGRDVQGFRDLFGHRAVVRPAPAHGDRFRSVGGGSILGTPDGDDLCPRILGHRGTPHRPHGAGLERGSGASGVVGVHRCQAWPANTTTVGVGWPPRRLRPVVPARPGDGVELGSGCGIVAAHRHQTRPGCARWAGRYRRRRRLNRLPSGSSWCRSAPSSWLGLACGPVATSQRTRAATYYGRWVSSGWGC